jgi:glucosamine-6-phosphate deaminase
MLGKFSQILLVVCLFCFASVNAQEEVIGDLITKLEQAFLEKSGLELKYPDEKVPVIVTTNFIELGKLTALRFIEWLLENPNGVVSLPTGTTAEYFIKYLTYYKHNWHSQKVQKELTRFGIQSENFPNTKNIKFVQQGDYYPISPKHIKSDANYIKKFYIDLLKLKPKNVLLMDIASKGILAEKGDKLIFHNGKVDLSIINKQPQTSLQKWQKQAIQETLDFCAAYEEKIRAWGGIGFFLTEVGLDGHVSFNLPGSEKNSRTRLVKLNYVAAANASIDLGGIEHALDKGAITIGIDTIKFNKNATYIVFASGVTKSKYIRDLVEGNQDARMPASLLQDLKNIKVYVTDSSSVALNARYR